MDRYYSKLFFKFLKRNKCFDAFMYNLLLFPTPSSAALINISKQLGNNRMQTFKIYVSSRRSVPERLITDSFSWASTREHGDYWNALSCQWAKYVKENIYEPEIHVK